MITPSKVTYRDNFKEPFAFIEIDEIIIGKFDIEVCRGCRSSMDMVEAALRHGIKDLIKIRVTKGILYVLKTNKSLQSFQSNHG